MRLKENMTQEDFEQSPPKKTLWIVEFIYTLIRQGYTGKVEINFFSGGISNVNKFESFKPPKDENMPFMVLPTKAKS
jgi:hypothetical protein